MILAQSATASPTATTTSVVHFHFTVAVYNSAGELVKTLSNNTPSQLNPAADFSIDKKVFSPGNGQAALILAGGQVNAWNGGNDSGQSVKNGVYYVKMEYTDSYGHVESMTKEITVLALGGSYSVIIFNSAGEEVKILALQNSSAGAPSKIDPDKHSLALGQGSGAAGSVTFDLGNGSSLSWDGTNMQGQKVAGGSYVAQLVNIQPGSPKSVASASLAVISAAGSVLDSAVLAPNPVKLAGPQGKGSFILRLNGPGGVDALGRLYNMAGELVLSADNGMQAGELRFEMAGSGVASGTYILSVTARAPWGTVERRNFKLAIFR